MSDLIVIGFKDEFKADEVLIDLMKLQREYLIDLEDAAVVVRNEIKEVGDTIEPGTSALFILVRKSTPDKVLEDLSKFEGKVLQTSLSKEDEAKLQEALTKSKAIQQ